MSEALAKIFHDLRSPLARALTYSKLLAEATEAERAEIHSALQKSLDDLDKLLRSLEEKIS